MTAMPAPTREPKFGLPGRITPKHTDKALDNATGQNERIAVDRSEARTFHFRMVAVAAGFVLALAAILVFSGNADLLRDVIKWMTAGGIGWAGGYGWASGRGS